MALTQRFPSTTTDGRCDTAAWHWGESPPEMSAAGARIEA